MSKYDVIIIGAGPGGIFTAYELITGLTAVLRYLKPDILWQRESARSTELRLRTVSIARAVRL